MGSTGCSRGALWEGVSPERLHVEMEAIGHYLRALFDFLVANDFETAVIYPIQPDAKHRIDSMCPAKITGIDASLVVDYLRYKCFVSSALGNEASRAPPL